MQDSIVLEPALIVGMKDISNYNGSFRDYIAKTGMELTDNATQSSSNLTAEQLDAVKQLRMEGEYYTIIINSEDQ